MNNQDSSLIDEACIIDNEDPIIYSNSLTAASSDSEFDESKIK